MMKGKGIFLNALVSLVVAIGVIWAYNQFFVEQSTDNPEVIWSEQQQPLRLANYDAVKSGKMTPVDFTYAAQLSTPAVVHVKKKYTSEQTFIPERFFDFFNTPQRQPRSELQTASGSGVIISSDGYIVSNNHVVENADELTVTLSDNRTVNAELVGTDPSTDIALLKIDEQDLPAMPFGNSDSIQVGEWVLAVGNPFDLASTVTAGIVSAKGRNINILRKQSNAPIESFIQTDAAVNPGNSGGALVDINGELIGINTAIATPTGTYAGYSFAVPTNIVQKVVRDLREFGVVQRPFLGVRIADIDTRLKEEEGLNSTKGVFIASVNDGSAADDAKLQEGDVITGINNDPVNTVAELQEKISLNRPGDKVQVIYLRNGSEYITDVVLKNKLNTTEVLKKEEMDMATLLGAKMKNLSASEANDYRRRGGVKIVELEDGILSDNTNIREGFVITKINDVPVSTVDDVTTLLSDVKSGEAIMIEGFYPRNPANSYIFAFKMK